MIDRRGTLSLGLGAGLAATGVRAQEPLALTGRLQQGGFALGRTRPGASILVDGEALNVAADDGVFVVGFDRDCALTTRIEVRAPGYSVARELRLVRGSFPTTRISGLPPSTVDPTDPALLDRIRREVVVKQEGFASRRPGDAFKNGFVWPLDEFRVSSRWGSQRILNGTPARPHYGIDLAAPAGAPIKAPADGVVALAASGLHYEGGLTLIDHGQGLISVYLHQSAQSVATGQAVRVGQVIGRVGATGRATGPHLCWRLKWRDRMMDPSLWIGARAPT